ncbi:Uncharacterized metal-binding protein [Clostridium collagenovorans DSM 3089]|uniref:Uncharacterized metal-binding protein n=1 Tax=Clostridium collagenovorans DSM 3089 TaxID=1121306 RepID=A0A1M5XXN8_9CLOT|nr:DUF1847 domain-containing protein [Clostridium collagenovorans]SHI04577.1 Uncharacterized metal-binding protein [Clostridium collagenovorans DSM 3089]
MFKCSICKLKGCYTGEKDKLPKVCPTRMEEKQERILALYEEEENKKIAYNAAVVEAKGYCVKTRLEETIEFFKKCGFKKIGLAFCVGLGKEAEKLTEVLKFHDFEVVSVICKNGAIPKSAIGLKPDEQVNPDKEEIMCNPIGQAMFLNENKTEYNILLGLCVGHDSLVIKYSEAPITVFAVKDRVLAHNPLACIYNADGYYKNKLFKK